MAEKLNVLVLEDERGAAAIARQEIAAAGHTVRTCHDEGRAAFPCHAFGDGAGCPLEGEPIDVVVDYRRRPRSSPTPLEDGVSCALREHIPLVLAGASVLSPYDAYATEVAARESDVVASCERAAAAPLQRHSAAAADALRDVLDRRELVSGARVTVRRRHGGLVISVADGESLDTATKSMAAVRMVAAVRAFDSRARGIDVVFEHAAAKD